MATQHIQDADCSCGMQQTADIGPSKQGMCLCTQHTGETTSQKHSNSPVPGMRLLQSCLTPHSSNHPCILQPTARHMHTHMPSIGEPATDTAVGTVQMPAQSITPKPFKEQSHVQVARIITTQQNSARSRIPCTRHVVHRMCSPRGRCCRALQLQAMLSTATAARSRKTV